MQVTKTVLKYVYRNIMSLFDALVLFCMRGEQGDGCEFVNVYFCFRKHTSAPGYSIDSSAVVSKGVQ